MSYRDIEERMQERGVSVDHSTVNRWVVHYKVLAGDGGLRTRELLREIAQNQEMVIHAGSINRDHEHGVPGSGGYLQAASSMVLNLLGLFAAGAVAAAFALWLILTLRAERAHKSDARAKHPCIPGD